MRTTLALTILVLACCCASWGQAAAEYSLAGSGSAVGASKSGSFTSNAFGSVSKRLGSALGSSFNSTSTQSTASQSARTPLESSIRSNRQLLDQQAKDQGCANLHITSAPKDATLFIDSQAVAATPAELCVPIGKHQLELKARGFRTWSQELTITAGQAISLAPTLSEEKQNAEYPRTVNLTF
jgi:hypothetical protein